MKLLPTILRFSLNLTSLVPTQTRTYILSKVQSSSKSAFRLVVAEHKLSPLQLRLRLCDDIELDIRNAALAGLPRLLPKEPFRRLAASQYVEAREAAAEKYDPTIHDAEYFSTLTNLCDDPEKQIRLTALQQLDHVSKSRELQEDELARLATSSYDETKLAALTHTRASNMDGALHRLALRLCDDQSYTVRKEALRWLRDLDLAEIKRLATSHYFDVRLAAIEHSEDKDITTTLRSQFIELCEDQDRRVRASAAKRLPKLDIREIRKLAASQYSAGKLAAVQHSKDKDIASELRELFLDLCGDKDSRVREEAKSRLPKLTVDEIKRLAASQYSTGKLAAIQHSKDKDIASELRELFLDLCGDKDSRVREEAKSRLPKLTIDEIRKLADSENELKRLVAVEHAEDPDIATILRPVFFKLCADSSSSVREEVTRRLPPLTTEEILQFAESDSTSKKQIAIDRSEVSDITGSLRSSFLKLCIDDNWSIRYTSLKHLRDVVRSSKLSCAEVQTLMNGGEEACLFAIENADLEDINTKLFLINYCCDNQIKIRSDSVSWLPTEAPIEVDLDNPMHREAMALMSEKLRAFEVDGNLLELILKIVKLRFDVTSQISSIATDRALSIGPWQPDYDTDAENERWSRKAERGEEKLEYISSELEKTKEQARILIGKAFNKLRDGDRNH